jgi:hypothetical protein
VFPARSRGDDLLVREAEAPSQAPSAKEGKFLAKLKKWYSHCEALKMATSDNAQLLALSGPRNPYQAGPLGVVKNGAYVDLILVDGNPLENLDLVADLGKNFSLCHKRTWQWSRCIMQIACDVVLRPQLESRCQQKKDRLPQPKVGWPE